MPELPDILLYLDVLRPRVVGGRLRAFRAVSPFVLRTYDPPVEAIEGRTVSAIGRIGKQFAFDFGEELFAITHLMIAGRWRWSDDPASKAPGKITVASFLFDRGALQLVEPSQKKRASIHLIRGRDTLKTFDRGGTDPLTSTVDDFAARLCGENHTLKRSLTDPRLFDGIGNAYSDEILHAARLSPLQLTARLTASEIASLHEATRSVLTQAHARLTAQFQGRFPGPGDVTAFRPEFAVHGKFGQPCPVCQTSVQRIRYAENETNYCPRCQTRGTVLADRSLSRLLKSDWPRSVEEWESGNNRSR